MANEIIIATSIYAAKEFLQKLVNPALEEVGGIFADEVKLWRLKNQTKIANKAESYLKSKNIATKKISLKVLTPLLEGSSMEEDESLQDKWAALLANTVAEGSKIDNTILSHILSQLTKLDADVFEYICEVCSVTSTSETGEIKLTVSYRERKSAYMSNLHSKFKDMDLSLENLIRLRLIKDERPDLFTVSIVSLTELGLRFMHACKFQ